LHRNAKTVFESILQINTLSKLSEFKQNYKYNDGRDFNSDYSDIAGDFSNLCTMENKLKKYNYQ